MSAVPRPQNGVIPAGLRNRRQWVIWRIEVRDNRPTKVLYRAQNILMRAKSTEPDTWSSYVVAMRSAKSHGDSWGVGYVLSADDPFVGFDLDNCIAYGVVHDAAQALIDQLASYTEITPSGSGLRVFVKGRKNGSRARVEKAPWGGKLEVYDQKRFLTITGDRLPNTPRRITLGQAAVTQIEQKFLREPSGAGRTLGRRVGRGVRRDPSTVRGGTEDPKHDAILSLVGGLWNMSVPNDGILERAKDFNSRIPEPMTAKRFNEEVPRMIEWLDRKATDEYWEFWGGSPVLRHIHDHAQANRIAPIAVLGCVLMRVCADLSHQVVLPGRGAGDNFGSLNSFVALIGEPGAGKDQALSEAGLVVAGLEDIEPFRPGSGEGLAHMFKGHAPKGEVGDTHGEVWKRRNVLFEEAEVETLLTLGGRKGATLISELRSVWTGGALGHEYADRTKRLHVPAHGYRVALAVGVQPTKAGLILSDVAGGLPQRFLWLLCKDRHAPRERGVAPERLVVYPAFAGDLGEGRREMSVCSEAEGEIDRLALARLLGEVEDLLHSHWLFSKLKVAALLAVLHGQEAVSEEWWRAADWVMRRSDEGRAVCAHESWASLQHSVAYKADVQAQIAVKTGQAVEVDERRRCRESVLRKERATKTEWTTRNEFRKHLAGPLRTYLADVLAELVADGTFEERVMKRGTAMTTGYRRGAR